MNPNYVLSNLVGNSTLTITDARLYISIVTLSAENNAKVSKLLSEGFKRSVYWNKYKIIPNKTYDENDNIRELLDSSYQGVKRLFVLAYRDQGGANRVTADSHRRYFLLQKIATWKLMEEIFMIKQFMIQVSNMMKSEKYQQDNVMITQLVVYWILHILKKMTLIAADLSKQKALDAVSRAIQQIIFTGKASKGVMIYYILEQSKETMLEFAKGTTKVL